MIDRSSSPLSSSFHTYCHPLIPSADKPSPLHSSSLHSFHHPLIPTVALYYSFLLTLLHWQALLSLFLPYFPLFHQSPSIPPLTGIFFSSFIPATKTHPSFFSPLFLAGNGKIPHINQILHLDKPNSFEWRCLDFFVAGIFPVPGRLGNSRVQYSLPLLKPFTSFSCGMEV